MATPLPLPADPAPQDKIDRVIAEIKAQRAHDLRAARKVRRWISWTAQLVIVLAALSFVLSIVATKLGIPSYTITILVTLTAGLEWLRQNRGWSDIHGAYWASADGCEALMGVFLNQNTTIDHDRVAKLDRDYRKLKEKRGADISKAEKAANARNLTGTFSSVKHDAKDDGKA
jgi:hypothetical protein